MHNQSTQELEPHHVQDEEFSETTTFLKVFGQKDGHLLKMCPKEWVITDTGFGPDITCCMGDCEPVTLSQMRKQTGEQDDKQAFMAF
jgi:hypothetical protein